MSAKKAGFLWLKEYLNLNGFALTHRSYIGNRDKTEISGPDRVDQTFKPKYAPEDDAYSHIVFALKYDDLNLAFLQAVFRKISEKELLENIARTPSGKYARIIGFLFEFLTGRTLELNFQLSGNYANVLDEKKYCTGAIEKDTRWRVNNNLPGNSQYCPTIRKTAAIRELLAFNLGDAINNLKREFSEDVFSRASRYLYTKETKSSYEIERETATSDRMERFVQTLSRAGSSDWDRFLTEGSLAHLQNSIVDPRFAARGYRDFQNFVGESLPNFIENIHYICPPPQFVYSLMNGLKTSVERVKDGPAVVSATISAYGFVFIHPFEDGNGRIHRFLIHDALIRAGAVPPGLIIPFSAYLLNNMKDYNASLEYYSNPLMKRIQYHKNPKEEVVVENPEAVEGYFRFPDLTQQCVFLGRTIRETLREAMPNELLFIQRYDELKTAVQNIVDMPDKDINLMIRFIHQNKGSLPKRRRRTFHKLTDEEIEGIESAYKEIFEWEAGE